MSGDGLEAMVKIQIDLKTKNHPDDVACVVDTGEITKTLQKEKLSFNTPLLYGICVALELLINVAQFCRIQDDARTNVDQFF